MYNIATNITEQGRYDEDCMVTKGAEGSWCDNINRQRW